MSNVGVLALQGDFSKHIEMFASIGVKAIPVKKIKDLRSCNKLVIPGGESTNIIKSIKQYELYDPIIEFSLKYPIMGTCAGIILLASHIEDNLIPLRLLDISVKRNAYGRQLDSFVADIKADFLGEKAYKGIFIRAPKILKISKTVKILIKYNEEAIMVRFGRILGLTFHPELTNDDRIHRYFMSL